MNTKILGVWVLCAIVLSACDPNMPTGDKAEVLQQQQMSDMARAQVGMPAINNFQEKRVLKQILELRDTKIVTITYTQDLNAGLHKLCDSIGYGIPYSTQFTNPMRPAQTYETHEQGNVTLPQADPNGLYSPASAEGTWVLCLNPETKDVVPVYVEPRIIVSPFPLPSGK